MRKFYTVLGLLAASCVAMAQTLPKAIVTYDFEGVTSAADLGGEQVGTGLFLQSSDENFGTYYQNNPEGVKASHQNYLILPTQGFIKSQAKSDEKFSIGFWMNAYVANAKQGMDASGHYYSTAIAGYSQTNSYKTFSWPMFSARTRRTLQINCNGWSDYTATENVTGSNVESNEWIATKTYDSEDLDEQGNPIKIDKGIDDNWHYVTITFNGLNAKYWVDGEIMNEWNATANSYYFVKAMNALDALYLGDCGPFWQDKDGAYAYDDIAFYADELSQSQIQLIMNIKRNELSEEDKLVIAQSQLQTAKDDFENYGAEINANGLFNSLVSGITDFLIDMGDPEDYTSIDEVNAAIAKISDKQSETKTIVDAFNDASAKIEYYTSFCSSTQYPDADAFNAAINNACEQMADPTSATTISEAMTALEAEKVTYIFSQTGDEIDVTRVINDPWFVDETCEPTIDEEGTLTFPADASSNLSMEDWTMSFSESLRGATDCTLYFTNGRSTANLFHSSTVADGVLDIQQTITGLPAGYYEVSADMSSSSAPTDNHIYAQSNGVTKVSEVPSTLAWTGVADWTTLTTDKVLVGEDGKLTIGATSTTDGTQYKGWFCVTNFRLMYYGTSYDMSEDLKAKTSDVSGAIENLILGGDKTNAYAELDNINNSDAIDYDKVSKLTTLLESVNKIYAQEKSFTALESVQSLAEKATSEAEKSVYNTCADAISAVMSNDTTTINALPGLTQLYDAYLSYANTAEAAESWGTNAASSELTSQLSTLTGSDVDAIAEKQSKLIAIMKSSIIEFEASIDNPKDISGLIGNASFDEDLHSAWTIDGTYAVSQAEIEFYNNSFDLSQILTDMPKGAYKLTASGFYRDGNDYAAIVQNYNDSTYYEHANMVLYAKSASFNATKPFVSIASDSISMGSEEDDSYNDYYGNIDHVATDFTTLNSSTDPVIYYPYWMWNAYNMVTNLGKYSGNEVIFAVTNDKEDVTIGVSKATTIAYDWSIIDNFHLYYLGQDTSVDINDVKDSSNSKSVSNIYSVSGSRISKTHKGINIIKMSDGSVQKVLVK